MTIGVVVIGRNEGDRLVACLRSAIADGARVVYVDSGSTDGSLAAARALQVETVSLDMAIPFTAARARNAGSKRLFEVNPSTAYVQFVDGDCELVEGWMAAAMAVLEESAALAVVTGWRREKRRNATVYNMMCDVEWLQPAGKIIACGGDMLVRRIAFEAVGGFNPAIIAAEDDDFCLRIGAAGWHLRRLPLEMTRHDAAIERFGQWWQRMKRAGHGFAQVGILHPGHFEDARRRAWLFGMVLPILGAGGAVMSLWIPLGVAGLYALSFGKTYVGLLRKPLTRGDAVTTAAFLVVAKLPNLQGILTYWLRRLRRREARLIEYK